MCGLLALYVSYAIYKDSKVNMSELFVIGIIIFLAGPISLIVLISNVIITWIKSQTKKKDSNDTN